MTKIKIVVIDPRDVFVSGHPFFRIFCQGCGHDDTHLSASPGERPLYPATLADAYLRAERMYTDHLSGDGYGGRRCPVDALLSVGVARSAKGICTRQTSPFDKIAATCPECGHNNLFHPGVSNPGLVRCGACVREARGL